MKPFMYIIIYRCDEQEKKDDHKDYIANGVEYILAEDEENVKKIALLYLDPSYRNKIDHLEVIVRPF